MTSINQSISLDRGEGQHTQDGPCTSVVRVFLSIKTSSCEGTITHTTTVTHLPVEEHHPRNSSRIVLPTVTLLLPPLFGNDLVLGYLGSGPHIFAASLVQEDGLEHMRA